MEEKKEEQQQQHQAEAAMEEQEEVPMEEKEEDKPAVPGSPLDADKDRKGFSSHKLIVFFILNFVYYMHVFVFLFDAVLLIAPSGAASHVDCH